MSLSIKINNKNVSNPLVKWLIAIVLIVFMSLALLVLLVLFSIISMTVVLWFTIAMGIILTIMSIAIGISQNQKRLENKQKKFPGK